MARIFISYAREDFKPVKELHQRLEGEGFIPWMDKVDLLAGQRWRPAIERAIQNTDFFVLCLSNHSVKKRSFVQREIKMALDMWQEKLEDDIYLIPVLLEYVAPEDIPDKLREIGWVFLYEEYGWDELLRALKHGMQQRAIEVSAERKREQELRALQDQLQQEEQRKAEERRAREAKAHEEEEQRKAEAKAREEEEQREAEELQRQEVKARQEEEQRQREAKAREIEERRKAEEQRQREAKARQEGENLKVEEQRQREEKAQQDKARLQAEQRSAAEAARVNRQRQQASSPWQNVLLKRAGVMAAVLLAGSLLGWLLLKKLSPALERVEVLRYSVEIKGETIRATSFSLTSGKSFKLHFKALTDGYLYLLAPDEGYMRIYLTAQPVKAGSDFADEWFTPDPKAKQGNITIIFSPEPPQLLKSLPAASGTELGNQQLIDLESLRKQAASSSPILKNSADRNSPSVIVTAAQSGQPVVFEIRPV